MFCVLKCLLLVVTCLGWGAHFRPSCSSTCIAIHALALTLALALAPTGGAATAHPLTALRPLSKSFFRVAVLGSLAVDGGRDLEGSARRGGARRTGGARPRPRDTAGARSRPRDTDGAPRRPPATVGPHPRPRDTCGAPPCPHDTLSRGGGPAARAHTTAVTLRRTPRHAPGSRGWAPPRLRAAAWRRCRAPTTAWQG